MYPPLCFFLLCSPTSHRQQRAHWLALVISSVVAICNIKVVSVFHWVTLYFSEQCTRVQRPRACACIDKVTSGLTISITRLLYVVFSLDVNYIIITRFIWNIKLIDINNEVGWFVLFYFSGLKCNSECRLPEAQKFFAHRQSRWLADR